jgi:hypothetical protein
MLYLRAIVFTVLVPVMVGFYLPSTMRQGEHLPGGICSGGWLLVGLGILLYVLSLLRFLAAGGTRGDA